jgi:hypothetical protein
LTAPTKGWLSFVTHECFHAFNVKRLRPVELGPFDYEHPPTTTSLWLSEGGTTYFAQLMLVRSGVITRDDFLESMSSAIVSLQKSPGRLLQSLEQSSAEVWNNSNSGVGAKPTTVSYYVKGNVASFLLDAQLRRVTGGKRSLDDVMRLASARYGGDRAFTAEEFRRTVEDVAGRGVKPWFTRAIESHPVYVADPHRPTNTVVESFYTRTRAPQTSSPRTFLAGGGHFGMLRINYTREELALGLAWRFRPRWRAYSELGFAYLMRSDEQEPWRWQSGVEYETRPVVFGGRMALYGAVDLSALEERSWRLDMSVQGGLVTRSAGHAYRIFAQWYDGRVPLGQFTRYSEASFSIGLKIDL